MRFAEPERLLSCVHCGLCLDACPTYLESGNEAESPRGRILLLRALEEGRLEPTPRVRAHIDSCLGCRACEAACPSGVPYGSLVEAARPFLEKGRTPSVRFARRILGAALSRRIPRQLAFAPLRAIGRARWLERLARATARTPFGSWLALAAAVPPAAPRPALPRVTEAQGRTRGTALFLTGCVAETLFPDTAAATIALLARAGVRVVVPRPQGCCGALSLHLGDADGARRLARRLSEDFALTGVDWVVASAAGCGALLRELDHLLPGSAAAEGIARATRDPLELLAELGLPEPTHALPCTVAVHDPCHLVHAQGISAPARALLASIPGLRLVPLEESDVCCGSAGTYNLTERSMAARLLARKIDRVAASGADVIAAANPGCLLQIRAGAIARGLRVEVEHPIDLLAAAHGVSELRRNA